MTSAQVALVTDVFPGWGSLVARQLASARMRLVVPYALQDGRADKACDQLRQSLPGADVTVMQLDRDDPRSVSHFVAQFAERFGRLDLLLLNANVARSRPPNGVEYSTGFFSLVRGLWPLLAAAAPSRVVLMTQSIVPVALARAPEAVDAADTSVARLLSAHGAASGITVNLYGLLGTRDFDERPAWYRMLAPLLEGSRGRVLATSQQAADMVLYLASAPQLGDAPAAHYIIRNRTGFPLGATPETDALIERLWGAATAG